MHVPGSVRKYDMPEQKKDTRSPIRSMLHLYRPLLHIRTHALQTEGNFGFIPPKPLSYY